MSQRLLLLLSFFSFSSIWVNDCLAQKAFEVVVYKGKIAGIGNIQLDLADGYLPGSILRLKKSENNTLKFSPSTGAPDSSGRWMFEPILPNQEMEKILLFFNQKEKIPHLRIPLEYTKGTKRSRTVLKPIGPK